MGESDRVQGASGTADFLRQCQNLLSDLLIDFGHLSYTRQMFRAVQDAMGPDPWLFSPLLPFQLWLVSNYMITCVAAIRRQTDTKDDAMSLMKFLAVLLEEPSAVTRNGFKGLYGPDDQAKADQLFDELVGRGEPILTREMVGLDKTELINRGTPIRKFATKRIAHHLENSDGLDAELDQINDCVDLATRIFCKYLVLLFGPQAPTIDRPLPDDLRQGLSKLFAQ